MLLIEPDHLYIKIYILFERDISNMFVMHKNIHIVELYNTGI